MNANKFFDDAFKTLMKQITSKTTHPKDIGVIVTATGQYRQIWSDFGLGRGEVPFKTGFSKHDTEWEGFVSALKEQGLVPFWEINYGEPVTNFWWILRVKPL